MKYLISTLILSLILLASTYVSATNYQKPHHNINVDNNIDVLHETSVLRDTDITNVVLQPVAVAERGYGDGVTCPEPTLGGVIYGDNNNVGGGVSVSFPLSFFTKKNCEMGEMKMAEQEAEMVLLCNELHKSNLVDKNSRIHKMCDKSVPLYNYPPKQESIGDKIRVSGHVNQR